MYRLLITGSQLWQSRVTIATALGEVYMRRGRDVTLVSGGCHIGGDMMCEVEAQAFSWKIEVHLAQWSKYGRRAGFIRNDLMVALGADECLAFIRNESPGASYTAKQARKVGIPVTIFREDDNDLGN